jgi:hypothetical protein
MTGGGHITWQDDELRLAALQIMLDQRRTKGEDQPTSEKMIAHILQVDRCPRFVQNIAFLTQNGFIQKIPNGYQITPAGYEFLLERLGGILPEPTSWPVLSLLLLRDEGMTVNELLGLLPDTSINEVEFALWYLMEKNYVQERDSRFIATSIGRGFAKHFKPAELIRPNQKPPSDGTDSPVHS